MTKRRRRKCLNCRRLFHPDPRNVRHQRYCSAPACRKVSKAASQALADALHFGAFSSEYIENLLESRDRLTAEPGPLHLTRPSDALELDLPDPES